MARNSRKRPAATRTVLAVDGLILAAAIPVRMVAAPRTAPSRDRLFTDAHFHLPSAVQEGTEIHEVLEITEDTVGRVALFGIPLRRAGSFENAGDVTILKESAAGEYR